MYFEKKRKKKITGEATVLSLCVPLNHDQNYSSSLEGQKWPGSKILTVNSSYIIRNEQRCLNYQMSFSKFCGPNFLYPNRSFFIEGKKMTRGMFGRA